MINNPHTQEPAPQSGKLVLPAPPVEEQRTYSGTQLRPEQLIRRRTQPAPKGTVSKLTYYWRKDPAYKVLIIALAMVVIAGVVFVSLASATFFGNQNFSASSLSQNPPPAPKATGTVDLRPTFPNPSGGNGTNQSSQPPLYQTPSLPSTSPTAQSSPTQGNGTLTIQITNIPSVVNNGSTVDVGVNASEPGASVLLVIRYNNAQPSRASAGPATTDGGGNATISWFVLVYGFRQRNVQATVYAVATDQNGQQARSQGVTVQVN
jgi:hypothetical protein